MHSGGHAQNLVFWLLDCAREFARDSASNSVTMSFINICHRAVSILPSPTTRPRRLYAEAPRDVVFRAKDRLYRAAVATLLRGSGICRAPGPEEGPHLFSKRRRQLCASCVRPRVTRHAAEPRPHRASRHNLALRVLLALRLAQRFAPFVCDFCPPRMALQRLPQRAGAGIMCHERETTAKLRGKSARHSTPCSCAEFMCRMFMCRESTQDAAFQTWPALAGMISVSPVNGRRSGSKAPRTILLRPLA